jgi:hypothetical protein
MPNPKKMPAPKIRDKEPERLAHTNNPTAAAKTVGTKIAEKPIREKLMPQ